MRIKPHQLQAISEQLARWQDRKGEALWKEYQRAELEWDALLKRQDYSTRIAFKAEEAGRRLKNWYDAKVKEQTEYVKKKDE